MKKYIFLLSLVFSVLLVGAQELKRSEVVKWIDGEKYYIHTVTKGQGMFFIQKLYQVNQKEILEHNPEIFDGLKLGQELKIPFKNLEQNNRVNNEFRWHTIEAGQTIYSISKIYNVSQEAIFALNPETMNGYKIGQKIKIPNEKEKKDNENQEVRTLKKYKVKRKDTLYGISKKFGVKQEDIIALNPVIAKEGLKRGQRIIIPKKEVIIKEALFVPVDSVQQVVLDTVNTVSEVQAPCGMAKIERYTPMNVVLMLPFELDIVSFAQELELPSEDFPKYKKKPFFEFYQSALLSVKLLKSEGYRINLYAYNTKRNVDEVKTILNKSVFEDVDLIIGPVYKPTFDIVKQFVRGKNIPLVNPIQKGGHLGQFSDMVFDVFPDDDLILESTTIFVQQMDTAQVFVVHSGSVEDLTLVEKFKQHYAPNRFNEMGESVSNYKELVFSDSREMDFKKLLNANKQNLMVVLSDEQAFVSNVYSRLNVLSEDFSIQVIGRPAWQKFSNIDVAYLHRLNTVRLQNEYVDYSNPDVVSYVNAYRELFKQEPTKYAFYGHDLVYNFTKYFYNWEHSACLTDFQHQGYILNMNLKRTGLGWKSANAFYVRYTPEITIERLVLP